MLSNKRTRKINDRKIRTAEPAKLPRKRSRQNRTLLPLISKILHRPAQLSLPHSKPNFSISLSPSTISLYYSHPPISSPPQSIDLHPVPSHTFLQPHQKSPNPQTHQIFPPPILPPKHSPDNNPPYGTKKTYPTPSTKKTQKKQKTPIFPIPLT